MQKNLARKSEKKTELTSESIETYTIIAQQGLVELSRPIQSLFWSGIAAGLLVSFSWISESIFRAYLPNSSWAYLIENLGYTVGFILVILCKLQLFTENTITPVLPTLTHPTKENFKKTANLWGVSLFANFIGTALAAFFIVHLGIVTPNVLDAALALGQHVEHISASSSFVRGLPAGLLIAAIVWMIPNSKGSEFWVIFLFTYIIALGDFTHVIVGSAELFALVWAGEAEILSIVFKNIIPTLAGNVIGGTGLFALLAWAQVRNEDVQEHVETED